MIPFHIGSIDCQEHVLRNERFKAHIRSFSERHINALHDSMKSTIKGVVCGITQVYDYEKHDIKYVTYAIDVFNLTEKETTSMVTLYVENTMDSMRAVRDWLDGKETFREKMFTFEVSFRAIELPLSHIKPVVPYITSISR